MTLDHLVEALIHGVSLEFGCVAISSGLRTSVASARTSKTPECGKTTLTAVIEAVVDKPLHASNISSAAVYRAVDKWHLTLIVDEADTFLRDNDAMRMLESRGLTKDGEASH